jgi:hypothetical protein
VREVDDIPDDIFSLACALFTTISQSLVSIRIELGFESLNLHTQFGIACLRYVSRRYKEGDLMASFLNPIQNSAANSPVRLARPRTSTAYGYSSGLPRGLQPGRMEPGLVGTLIIRWE